MKRRLLSILLIPCMVLTLLPVMTYGLTTYSSAEVSNEYYASVDDLETNSGTVITLGKNSRGKNGNQKWFVFGKDDGVSGRNTMLFAATSLTDSSGSEQLEVFQRVLQDSRIAYDSSWGSSYTDGAAAPTEVDISYYAASYSRWRLRDIISNDNQRFNRVEKALLNETPYKNTDLGNNNRIYTLKDKLYLPAIKPSEKDTIYIGSNDQIQIKSTKADYCNAAWSRTAFDNQNVSAYSVSIDTSIYTGSYLVHNFYTNQFGSEQVVWGKEAAMLPATNLDLDKVLFASMVPIQNKNLTDHAGETKAELISTNEVYDPMALRLDAEEHGKEIGEVYVNYDKNEIYAKNVGSSSGSPRRWLVVQYPPENIIFGLNGENGYWCKDISASSEDTDEYGFVHIKLDDIQVDGKTKLSSLENCKIWMEATLDNAANSSVSAVYTYAVTPKPLPEKTVTVISKHYDDKTGEEVLQTTETITVPAGDTFTYSYKNKDSYDLPKSISNDKNKKILRDESDYALHRFRIDNIWEDLTVEVTYSHYCGEKTYETIAGTSPTCTESGLSSKIYCRICGKVNQEQTELPALGHDLKVVNTATCDTSGHIISTCQREGCDYSKMETSAMLGHDWEIETISATCTEGGLVKRTCKRDSSHVETVTSAALGHDWEKDFTVEVEPTCETAGSKSRHCTRCDEKTDVTEIPALGHNSSWICSINVTVEAPKCGTVVKERTSYSPEPPPMVTTPKDASYWLLRSQNPDSTDTSWRTVTDKIFTGTIIGGQTYCAEFSLEPKMGSPFFVPDDEDIRSHLTINGGDLKKLKLNYIWNTKNCNKIQFDVLVTAEHDYDENGICRGCGIANHEHAFEEAWSTDEINHWHACDQDGCTITKDFDTHSFGSDNATCETCGYVRTITCQHDFGSYLCDDTQHWKECRKPGCNAVTNRGKHSLSPSYKNGVLEYYWCQDCSSYQTHDHNITDDWSTSGTHHWKQCHVGSGYCKFVSEYAEHDYGSETGTECVTCGYTRTICDHTYSTGFNQWDETGHWRECTNPACTDRSGSLKDKEAHSLNAYGDCTACGYRHSDHTYGSWHFDGTDHWKTCTKPGCEVQTKKTGHTYSGNICSVCGYDSSITPAHTHFYGGWSRDSQNHWRECANPNCSEETGRIIDKAAHIYDDDKDTTCNLCGYVRTVDPDHSGGHVYGDWSKDVNSHWHECVDPNCSDKAGSVQDKANHVYDNDSDSECNDCGYERSTILSHTHTFDGWSHDAERHYRICSAKYCPYRDEMDSAPHVYDDDQDEFCNVCAYGRFGMQHEHTYGDWTADGETGHYRICTNENCPYVDNGKVTEAHVYDDDADMICNTCGYDRTVTPPAHEHSYGDWSKDEVNHWHECTDTDCPDKTESIKDKAVHDYDNDADTTCNTCGYERTVIPAAKHTVTVNGSYAALTGAGEYAAGNQITIYAGIRSGYTFAGWTSDDVEITDPHSPSASFLMPDKNVTVKANWVYTNRFVDVPADSYYYEAVLWAAEDGITAGTDATHFSPNGICTRAQAITFLWRAAGSPAPKTNTMPFTDVPEGSYYYDAVLWAVENGITFGTSETTFSPNMACSRAQTITLLWRSEKSPAAGSINPFTDVSTDTYYYDAVLWAVENDITKGTTNTTFSPDMDCTRAQMVTFLWCCKK